MQREWKATIPPPPPPPPPSPIPAMANIETGYAYQLSLARHPKTILLLAVRYSIGQVYRKSGYNAMVQRYIATCVFCTATLSAALV